MLKSWNITHPSLPYPVGSYTEEPALKRKVMRLINERKKKRERVAILFANKSTWDCRTYISYSMNIHQYHFGHFVGPHFPSGLATGPKYLHHIEVILPTYPAVLLPLAVPWNSLQSYPCPRRLPSYPCPGRLPSYPIWPATWFEESYLAISLPETRVLDALHRDNGRGNFHLSLQPIRNNLGHPTSQIILLESRPGDLL